MSTRLGWWLGCILALCWLSAIGKAQDTAPFPRSGEYVGASVCIECHKPQHQRLLRGSHALILQSAELVGCETCHGRVDNMALTAQGPNMEMRWCLDCHRAPEKYVRPREFVTKMGYEPAEPQEVLGPKLVKEYNIQKLETCWTCHR